MLRPLAFAILIALPLPAAAQDLEDQLREGLEGLMQDMMRELGPALEEGLRTLEQLDAYEAPEMLPNGDIIIRRKRGPELPAPGEDAPVWL